MVVCGDLLGGGGGGQRAEFQQQSGGGRAVEVSVGDDRAVVGALGAAVVGVQVLNELRAGLAERDGPGCGVAVGVAGVAGMSPRPMPAAGMRSSTATRARAG